MNSASCCRSHLAIYFFPRMRALRAQGEVNRFYVQYFSTLNCIAKQRNRAESDFSHEFDRITRRGQRHIGIRFQTIARGQKVFTLTDKKVKSIFLSSLALRGHRWFSSLIFLWPGVTSGTPAASILSSVDLWPLHERARM